MNKSIKKEIILYSIIAVILIIISILNSTIWKIGKEDNGVVNEYIKEEVQLLEVNNITYNVPFEEQWLD